MLPKIVFPIFIGILIFQIVSLEPRLFSFGNHSVGTFTTVSEEVGFFAQKMYAEATLTGSSQATEYDGVVFVGDVMLGRHVETLLNRYGSGYPYTSAELKSVSQNPAVVANFESAVATSHTQTPAGAMKFSVTEAHLPTFAEHFTHVSLANNHSLDYGEAGYLNAVSLLTKYSVSVFGHNSVVDKEAVTFLDTQRGRIALIGINATARIPDESEVASVCASAKRQSDFQVFFVHWGDEYVTVHTQTQRVMAEMFVDQCADVIIGHHPHVVQDVDLIKGVPVFYSLGNYIFDQYFSKDVQTGLVVALLFEETPVLELQPVTSEVVKSVPEPMGPDSRLTFLTELADRSHPSLRSSILNGRINLFEPVATSTKIAIMSR